MILSAWLPVQGKGCRKLFGTLLFLSLLVGLTRAQPGPLDELTSEQRDGVGAAALAPTADSRTADEATSLCRLMKSIASQNGLPYEFFARVIWQESRFKSNAIGPLTRGGQRAQGIAQFMPGTAAERSLHDPFDPAEALPKSAEFLRDLRAQFGNLGFAAAAYNAGPQRVRDWIAGKRSLPLETQNYVRSITGRSAQEWTRPESAAWSVPAAPSDTSCFELVKLRPASPVTPAEVPERQTKPWIVQLFGDPSETRVLALFRQLQKKHDSILRDYKPEVVQTRLNGTAIWSRVRVDVGTLQAAQALCSNLRAAGEECLIQRNN
jgi:hypothetical protein